MTSTPLTNLATPARPRPLITPVGWVWIVLCAAFFGWMHSNFLHKTWLWSKDPNWSHVLIIPLISIYYIHQHKTRLQAAPKRLCWWALPLIFLGLYSYIFWIFPGRNDMFRGYSMVFTVFATVLFLLGPAAMRVLWFPIAYLVFAIKISDSIWSRVAERLQDIAASGATVMLQICAEFMDFTINTVGNTITLGFMKNGAWTEFPMNVAEACAGLRMLMAFIALGVALAFLFDRTWWQRLIMVSLAVPIAVAVNIGRVTALGIIATYDQEYAQGSFHLFVGMLMLIPAAGLFLLVGWVLDQIVIRESADDVSDSAARVDRHGAASTANPGGSLALSTVLKGVGFGVALTLCTGVIYAMVFNTLSAKPLFSALGPTTSIVLGAIGLLGLIVLSIFARRSAPSRRGMVSLMFAAALVCGLFGTAALGKTSVLSWQKIILHKEAVDLRHPLTDLPLDKGPYVFIEDQVLPPEIVDELGTEDYLSRWYKNTNVPEGKPGHLLRLHVAYYTGLTDTVPHVPDRCFVAGGAEHKGLHSQLIPIDPEIATPREDGQGFGATAILPRPGEPKYAPGTVVTLPERDIDAARFTYGQPNSADQDQHVIYFFAANGQFLASPNAVRAQGFDIRDQYSYYCKIEVQVVGETDPQKFAVGATALLDEFLPEILACLPDWDEVKTGRWPIADQPAE